jgi:hypothetical protein
MAYKNITDDDNVKSGRGELDRIIINSHTSGTIKLLDGNSATASAGVYDTGVFTGTDVLTDGETITIGSVTYTMVDALSEDTGDPVANEVLIGTLAVSLDNLKLAINAGTGEGTKYSTGTKAHPDVIATTNTDTAQTVQYKTLGVVANSIATTETCADASWGAVTLEGGVDVNTLICNTYTLASGSQILEFGMMPFTNGLYIDFEGTTVDATVIYN